MDAPLLARFLSCGTAKVFCLIKFTLTKACKEAPRNFALVPFRDAWVCPVFWPDYFIRACGVLGVNLSGEYFFHASDHRKRARKRSLFGSAVNNRLHLHLRKANLEDGETPQFPGWPFGYPEHARLLPGTNITILGVGAAERWPGIIRARLRLPQRSHCSSL